MFSMYKILIYNIILHHKGSKSIKTVQLPKITLFCLFFKNLKHSFPSPMLKIIQCPHYGKRDLKNKEEKGT